MNFDTTHWLRWETLAIPCDSYQKKVKTTTCCLTGNLSAQHAGNLLHAPLLNFPCRHSYPGSPVVTLARPWSPVASIIPPRFRITWRTNRLTGKKEMRTKTAVSKYYRPMQELKGRAPANLLQYHASQAQASQVLLFTRLSAHLDELLRKRNLVFPPVLRWGKDSLLVRLSSYTSTHYKGSLRTTKTTEFCHFTLQRLAWLPKTVGKIADNRSSFHCCLCMDRLTLCKQLSV